MNAAPHTDLTAVTLDDLARQSEAEPGPLVILGREKGLKESAQVVGRNSVPVVRHKDAEIVATLANAKRIWITPDYSGTGLLRGDYSGTGRNNSHQKSEVGAQITPGRFRQAGRTPCNYETW
jgi:hypothetical protein